MGSISNPGISNLAQILALSGAPMASAAISSPTGQTSLENAPIGDLVQLSSQALTLQETAGLFGGGASSSASNLFYSPTASLFSSPSALSSLGSLTSSLSSPSSLLESFAAPSSLDSLTSSLASPSSLLSSLTAAATTSSGAASGTQQTGSNSTSPSEQVAEYVAAIQAQEAQALFSTPTQTNQGANLVNLLA